MLFHNYVLFVLRRLLYYDAIADIVCTRRKIKVYYMMQLHEFTDCFVLPKRTVINLMEVAII